MKRTSRQEREKIKFDVLQQIAGSKEVWRRPKSMFEIGNKIVHARFCKRNERSLSKFKFNINPNTLRADYELWICGSAKIYYLMPISFICKLYDHPNAYEDNRHEGIKVVSVDVKDDEVMYARGGEKEPLST